MHLFQFSICLGDIIMYVTGVPVCFILYRSLIRSRNEGYWIVMEKVIAFFLALLSWFGFGAFIIFILLTHLNTIDPDKKCKW